MVIDVNKVGVPGRVSEDPGKYYGASTAEARSKLYYKLSSAPTKTFLKGVAQLYHLVDLILSFV